MPDAQHITVKPLSGISSDEARKARARAWSFIFQCWQKKQGGSPLTAPDDAKEIEHVRAAPKYTRSP